LIPDFAGRSQLSEDIESYTEDVTESIKRRANKRKYWSETEDAKLA
jgi:hypothetical protein